MDKAGLPLRRVLADDSACRTPADADRLGRRQLGADEVGVGAEPLAQRAEEAPARVVLEEEACARSNHHALVGGEHITYDNFAVAGHWRIALLVC